MKVVASERIEPLVADLARLIRTEPLEPMTSEWIAVGSEGLQRWLQLELARHLGAQPGRTDGVAANIEFRYPGTLRTAVLLAGRSNSEYDPWFADRLTWSVFETLQLNGPVDAILSPLVDGSTKSVHRRSSQIAERFSAYQMHRPEMIRAWLSKEDLDAAGRPLHSSQLWQPHLWRLVRSHLGVESPAERLSQALADVRSNAISLELDGAELPPRLIFFGPSLLPTGAGFLEVAEAVAAHRDVWVYVIEPSAPLSESLRSSGSRPVISRAHDVSAELALHPLLRSWGRLQRETALLLSGLPVETVPPEPPSRLSLLHCLQSELRGNDAPAGAFGLSETDRSIAIHRCYGPTRQVEALRDALLRLLDDPQLELTEDDIIVASPALEKFAPLVRAVFGPSATEKHSVTADGSPLLRYRITGLPGSTDNPMVEGLLAALRLATSRFDVTEVLEFLSQPPVRQRFNWTDENLDSLGAWVDDTNVRWGLDGEHRALFGMPAEVQSFTWRNAIDQLLLGTAARVDDDFTIGQVVPVALGADTPALVGQLASILDVLGSLSDDAVTPRPISEWQQLLSGLVDRLFAPDPDAEWQLDSLQRLLIRIEDSARLARVGAAVDESGVPLPSAALIGFGEMRQLVESSAAEQRSRSDFFRGGITVTSLNSLRNVPARVVCLLGADQSAFSAGGIDSDDLIGLNPRLGDRDRRAEVRQSLLDALLAAKDHFLVFSDAFDVCDSSELPHAVVIAELLDAVDLTCTDDQASTSVVRVHPRQPFAESYFDGNESGHRSFSRGALAAAEARRLRDPSAGSIDWPRVVLSSPVTDRTEYIELDTLKAVLKDPTKVFLHDGLGIRLPSEVDQRSAELPLEGHGLADWALGTELMELLREGREVDRWIDIQTSVGKLPPLSLGTERVSALRSEAERINEAARSEGVASSEGKVVPVEFDLDDGRRLTGRVMTSLVGDRRGVASVRFTKDSPDNHLRAWVDLLALTAMDDSRSWQAVLINRTSKKPGKRNPDPGPCITVLDTGELDSIRARQTLTMLAALHDTAIRQPVPFFPRVFQRLSTDQPRPNDWRNNRKPLSAEVLYVYGDIALRDLMMITAAGHPLLDPELPLAEGYANHIWEAFETTVTVESGDSDV